MWTTEDHTVAAGHSVAPASWQARLDELLGRIAGRFARVEPRRHARALVLGLLADLPRKNCWTIAEHAGHASPDGLQHLLAGAVWDHDAVRDYLVEHLGDPAAVLVVDETGDLKKGASTVGVQRQYTGTAGKVDNAQVAVYLAYTTAAGHGVIDRELYLPQGWLDDPARCRAAGVPAQRAFATKPELARVMLERALEAGVPAGWVTADEVYGNSPALRGWLEGRRMPYVLAVKSTEPLPSRRGPSTSAARLAKQIPPECWLRLSAGQGAKGRRWYGWSRLPLDGAGAPEGWQRWLLVRRNLRTAELAYYLCAGPASTSLVGLVRVAGTRWRVEEAFQAAKGLCGLDQHQVRRWRCWYRWVTLAMLAYAFLVVAAVTEHARHRAPLGLIPLTCNELQHLFATLVTVPMVAPGHRLRWSWWRRR
jgi:SRSO17 transposase